MLNIYSYSYHPAQSLTDSHDLSFKIVVPNLFGTKDQFCVRQSFQGQGWDGFEVIQAYCLYCDLLYRLYFRSLDIRSHRLGTSALGETENKNIYLWCSMII